MNLIEEKVQSFFSNYPTIDLQENEIVIQFHEAYPDIYYLESGSIEQYDISKNGKKVTLNIYKLKSFFPLLPLLSSKPNTYFFSANEQICSLKKAPRNDVYDFLRDNPDVLLDLTARLYKGMDGLLKRLNIALAGSAEQRVLVELKIIAERFSSNTIEISVSQLADQVGLTRETVSRILSKLEKENVLIHKKGTISLN